jgi:hypothetical protein
VDYYSDKLERLSLAAKAAGIRMVWVAPWPYRLAWSLGARWRPPIFAGFAFNVMVHASAWLVLALPFALAMLHWMGRPHEGLADAAWLGGGALLVGSYSASRVRVARRRLGQSTWKTLVERVK